MLFSAVTVSAQAPATTPESDATQSSVQRTLDGFVQAFNNHDVNAMLSFWKPTAIHQQITAGETLQGKQAISDAYTALFKQDSKAVLQVTLNSIRAITNNVIDAKCSTEIRHSDQSVSYSKFAAILVRDGDGWLFDQVRESDVPVQQQLPQSALQAFDWFVGTWTDSNDTVQVTNRVEWDRGGSFLIRHWQSLAATGQLQSGMQLIGWDGEQGVYRSWVFESDGTFGEGVWQQTAEQTWQCHLVIKRPDGRRGSFTQVVEQRSSHELSFRTVNVQVDGQALPSSGPEQLLRQAD
ncbi:nuclear transport factor 2 family protein [Stieleria tagensis]|uniref:nuclear transport factor 2 family protein n=1 Tax=Stieleria tagensis TaxID=2956795 RepID=UPI00209B3837|nr:nuclear transport factor 2 family protein [Stieleria tagensis]